MKNFILIVCIILFTSCAPLKKDVIAKSTVKLEDKNTDIRNFIDIDGYYSNWVNPYDNCLMFFEDGTCSSFSLKRDVSENEIKNNLSESVISWIQEKQFRWGDFGVFTKL